MFHGVVGDGVFHGVVGDGVFHGVVFHGVGSSVCFGVCFECSYFIFPSKIKNSRAAVVPRPLHYMEMAFPFRRRTCVFIPWTAVVPRPL